ncbi:MAG: fibronectin type III domain-containing protein [Bryobacteraceae bacterium]|nr:fibronectin type III domain-containing protein [Bryobacteraceae bacterium]
MKSASRLVAALFVLLTPAFAVDPPAKINGLAPISYPAGGNAGFKLLVGGSPMSADTVVRWNGHERPTRYLNSVGVEADISAADIATPGTAVVTVYRPGIGLSNELIFQITSSAVASPLINGMSPSFVAAGASAFTLTVNGALFTSDCVVRYNGADKPTVFVDSKTLRVSIASADVAKSGVATITVHRPNLTPSNEWFLLIGTPGAPTLTSVHPPAVLKDSPDITIVLKGKAFTASDSVRWNGTARPATFISAEELRAAIPASDLAQAGTVNVQVYQALSGFTNGWTFRIGTPASSSPGGGGGGGGGMGGISLTSLSPSVVLAGSAAFTLTVNGSGFTSSSQVSWNGVARQTTYVNASQLRAAILASDIASGGSGVVTVSEPGGGSASMEVMITSFSALPEVPTSPSPADLSTVSAQTVALSWSASQGATSYDVYFGTSAAPPFVANVAAPVYQLPALVPDTTYYWRVAAKNANGSSNALTWQFRTAAIVVTSYHFVPITPCRVVDTRAGQGTAGAFGPPSMSGNTTRSFPLPSGGCGLPLTAKAYSLNVTVAPKEPLGYLTLWPTGQNMPVVSTLNSFHGGLVANAAIVPAGAAGAISAYVTNAADVIIDVNGYFDNASGALSFYTANPCRAVDTRAGSGFNGLFGAPSLAGQTSRDFPLLSGSCSIYAAQAYSLNATVVPHGPLGYLSLWPAGSTRPVVSTLNALDGAVVANAAIVRAGVNGALSAFVTDASDLILDMNGYFGPAGLHGELKYVPLTPCRVADTRQAGAGAPVMAANETRGFAVGGKCGAPESAKAFALNVTVVPSGPLGYLSLWPLGQAQPVVSTLNSSLGRVVANAAIVRAGAAGAVSVFVTDQTHVILDINGFFE